MCKALYEIFGIWVVMQLMLLAIVIASYIIGAFAQLDLLWFMNLAIHKWVIFRALLATWWFISAGYAVAVYGMRN